MLYLVYTCASSIACLRLSACNCKLSLKPSISRCACAKTSDCFFEKSYNVLYSLVFLIVFCDKFVAYCHQHGGLCYIWLVYSPPTLRISTRAPARRSSWRTLLLIYYGLEARSWGALLPQLLPRVFVRQQEWVSKDRWEFSMHDSVRHISMMFTSGDLSLELPSSVPPTCSCFNGAWGKVVASKEDKSWLVSKRIICVRDILNSSR